MFNWVVTRIHKNVLNTVKRLVIDFGLIPESKVEDLILQLISIKTRKEPDKKQSMFPQPLDYEKMYNDLNERHLGTLKLLAAIVMGNNGKLIVFERDLLSAESTSLEVSRDELPNAMVLRSKRI